MTDISLHNYISNIKDELDVIFLISITQKNNQIFIEATKNSFIVKLKNTSNNNNNNNNNNKKQTIVIIIKTQWSYKTNSFLAFRLLCLGKIHLVRTQNFYEKLNFLHRYPCAYQGVRNIYFCWFFGKFYVRTKWMILCAKQHFMSAIENWHS